MKYPDLTKEFIVTTDASDIALWAVLSAGSAKIHIICYIHISSVIPKSCIQDKIIN